ncbi:MAG: DUF1788 domain-containing protein [Methylococcaceae bacterium]|nr:DUF1788 domain-containing protein [Methylococcaceae bacterium]MCI0732267.1 DUF1788 domain-containing protein [Methylococcaceae bacterium]
MATLLPKYRSFIIEEFANFLEHNNIGENSVVAVKGVGSLFGLLKVKEVVDKLAPMVKGRLLVFFPGSYENNRDIYQKDPATRKLINEGVANVNDEKTSLALAVLR